MNKSFEFVANDEGIQELLKGAAMQKILVSEASDRTSKAGKGYTYSAHVGERRAYVNIYPITKEAMEDNLEHNTLERVIKCSSQQF